MERLDCDRMFVAVMETGSFTAAAQRCGTSHGQASKLISRLESELGVNLLRRSTRSLTPTEVGLAYYERIRQLLVDYDALNDSVRNSANAPSGLLRISAPVTFGVSQLAPIWWNSPAATRISNWMSAFPTGWLTWWMKVLIWPCVSAA
jgi:DNA-binding transcriptional LysR family regulator